MTDVGIAVPWFRSARAWIFMGVLAPVGMLVLSGLMLLDLRQDAWDKADQTSKNLLQVLERDIARNVEIFDLALQAVVDNLKAPGIREASPELRQLILFDRAVTAKDMGVMLVLNEHGDILVDSGSVKPRSMSYADRDYFRAHKERDDLGLFVGQPATSRLTGQRMIPFSRRINKADGSFGGLVLGTLQTSYFQRLFDQIGLGREGAINLYHRNGTRIMRFPARSSDIGGSIAGTANFDRFIRDAPGSFVAKAVRDGVGRFYNFTMIGNLPLLLNVALSTDEIEAEWRAKALVICAALLTLGGFTISLSLLLGRELRVSSGMQAELDRLSRTDALTGVPNRRHFDDELQRAWSSGRRTGKPLSILAVDVDHFKLINDRFGHATGDEVLKGLARSLSISVHRPSDLVCRIGGEEFVVMLPDTDVEGAERVAELIHSEISQIAVRDTGIRAGAVTISIGIATEEWRAPSDLAISLVQRADQALYAAKSAGRNQTKLAPALPLTPHLRLAS